MRGVGRHGRAIPNAEYAFRGGGQIAAGAPASMEGSGLGVSPVPASLGCYSAPKEPDSAPTGALPHSGTAIAVPKREAKPCPQR